MLHFLSFIGKKDLLLSISVHNLLNCILIDQQGWMDGMKATAFLNRCLHFKATSADLFTMVYYYGLLQLIYLLFLGFWKRYVVLRLNFKVQKKHLTILLWWTTAKHFRSLFFFAILFWFDLLSFFFFFVAM